MAEDSQVPAENCLCPGMAQLCAKLSQLSLKDGSAGSEDSPESPRRSMLDLLGLSGKYGNVEEEPVAQVTAITSDPTPALENIKEDEEAMPVAVDDAGDIGSSAERQQNDQKPQEAKHLADAAEGWNVEEEPVKRVTTVTSDPTLAVEKINEDKDETPIAVDHTGDTGSSAERQNNDQKPQEEAEPLADAAEGWNVEEEPVKRVTTVTSDPTLAVEKINEDKDETPIAVDHAGDTGSSAERQNNDQKPQEEAEPLADAAEGSDKLPSVYDGSADSASKHGTDISHPSNTNLAAEEEPAGVAPEYARDDREAEETPGHADDGNEIAALPRRE